MHSRAIERVAINTKLERSLWRYPDGDTLWLDNTIVRIRLDDGWWVALDTPDPTLPATQRQGFCVPPRVAAEVGKVARDAVPAPERAPFGDSAMKITQTRIHAPTGDWIETTPVTNTTGERICCLVESMRRLPWPEEY